MLQPCEGWWARRPSIARITYFAKFVNLPKLASIGVVMYTEGKNEGHKMSAESEYKTKGQAAAHISVMTGRGIPTAERALKQLADEGRIHPVKRSYAILYSPEDVELVIRVLKGEKS